MYVFDLFKKFEYKSVLNFKTDRLCVVDGKGAFKKVFRLCPKLDLQNSLVECIVGIDRYLFLNYKKKTGQTGLSHL